MKRIIAIFASFLVVLLFGTAQVVFADTASSTVDDVCSTATTANGGEKPTYCTELEKTTKEENPVVATISKVANILAFISGAVAVIMVMYGGFQFMTSNGDSGKVAKGRDTILYAAVGLVVIIAARLIVNFAVMVLIK